MQALPSDVQGSARATTFAVTAFALAWLLLDGFVIPPDFGHTDIYYFKDAGINLAEGLGLTTRFTYGNPTFLYKDFATYPPIYPFLFGVFVKLWGVSAVSNQAFNALVGTILGLVGYWILRPIISSDAHGKAGRRVALAVAASSIATGFYMPAYDRPDGMGVAFGMAALALAVRGRRVPSAIAAGALSALTLFTSPFAGVFTILAVTIGIMAISRTSSLKASLARLLLTGAGAVTVALLLLGALVLALPGWFDGFLGVASGSNTHNETGGGYFIALLHGDWRTWLSGFPYSTPGSCIPLLRIGSVITGLAVVTLIRIRRNSSLRPAWRLVPFILVSPLCLLTSPYQTHYVGISAALLVASWVAIESSMPNGCAKPARLAILLIFGFNALLSASLEAQRTFIRFDAQESMERATLFLSSHRSPLESPGRYTAVSPINYILWRQVGLHPLINIYSGFNDPESRRHVGFFALAYPGSGDLLQPQKVESMKTEEYSMASQPQLPQRATLFTHQISKSSQTWESAIYERRQPGIPDSPLFEHHQQ
jgi:hypothetical protein